MRRVIFKLLISALLFISFSQVPHADEPVIKGYNRPGTDRKGGIYTNGMLVGKTYYTGGKGSRVPKEFRKEYTKLIEIPGGSGMMPESVADRWRENFRKTREILEWAGLGLEHVIQVDMVMDDLDVYYEEMNNLIRESFPNGYPTVIALETGGDTGGGSEHTTISYTNLSEVKRIGTPTLNIPMSPGILAGNTLYTSAMGDHLSDGKHPATFEEQVRQAMKNVGEVLKEAGLDFRHVVSTKVYLDNYDNYGIANKVYSEFIEYGNEPARSTVFVDMIPNGTHVAIACVATTDLSNRKVVRPANRKYGPGERAPTANPGVWAGDMLYISAQNSYDPETGMIGDDLETQFNQMIRNQLDVLEAAGLGIDNVVKSDVHLRTLDHYHPMNTIYLKVFSIYPPPRITLQMNSGYEKNKVLVKTIFVAARGKKE